MSDFLNALLAALLIALQGALLVQLVDAPNTRVTPHTALAKATMKPAA